jgi:hypothetical protein
LRIEQAQDDWSVIWRGQAAIPVTAGAGKTNEPFGNIKIGMNWDSSSAEKDAAGEVLIAAHSPLWLKVKNPNAPAVKREAEEDWGR